MTEDKLYKPAYARFIKEKTPFDSVKEARDLLTTMLTETLIQLLLRSLSTSLP